MPQDHPDFIAINRTPAMSGYFATLYSWEEMETVVASVTTTTGFYSPWTSGHGRYDNWEDAQAEAEAWAKAEGLKCEPCTQADIDAALERLEKMREGLDATRQRVMQERAEKHILEHFKRLYPDQSMYPTTCIEVSSPTEKSIGVVVALPTRVVFMQVEGPEDYFCFAMVTDAGEISRDAMIYIKKP